MVDHDTIDSFLIQMGKPTQHLNEGVWRVEDENPGVPPVIVSFRPPIVFVSLKVMDLPEQGQEALYRKLLEYNASGIAFGAYAIQGREVVLIDTLAAETMAMSELQASIDSLVLAAQEHYPSLSALVQQGQE